MESMWEVFPTKTAKFLFWIGVVVPVVGVIEAAYTTFLTLSEARVSYSASVFVASIFSSLWQGGLLIGIAKILEKLHANANYHD
jgi:phage-related protein